MKAISKTKLTIPSIRNRLQLVKILSVLGQEIELPIPVQFQMDLFPLNEFIPYASFSRLQAPEQKPSQKHIHDG